MKTNMNNYPFLEKIFNFSHNVESVIILSASGLPIAWKSRENDSIEEITSIAASLFSTGQTYNLLSETKALRLLIKTDHGYMYIMRLPDDTLLLVLLLGQWQERAIEAIINEAMEKSLNQVL